MLCGVSGEVRVDMATVKECKNVYIVFTRKETLLELVTKGLKKGQLVGVVFFSIPYFPLVYQLRDVRDVV